MGVIKHFSSDSRETVREVFIERTVSTPDPTNFRILKKETINGFPIFLVKYPGVENYEGRKILMYQRYFNTDIIAYRMDPHFFTTGDSPIARFEPTDYGWELAETLAKSMHK